MPVVVAAVLVAQAAPVVAVVAARWTATVQPAPTGWAVAVVAAAVAVLVAKLVARAAPVW
jgi:hypothetical protein